MKIAFFSDLHLPNRPTDPAYRAFCTVLSQLASDKEMTHLFLMGDIFDLLVGNFDFWRKRHKIFFEQLAKLRDAGVEIVWFEGNHDFFLQDLVAPFGVRMVEDDETLTVGGKKIFLSHGDTVNPNDEAYLRWRKVIKSPVFRKSLSLAPAFLGELAMLPLAERASKSSRKRNRQSASFELRELYKKYAAEKIREGVDGVVLGHNHALELQPLGQGFYLNLGGREEREFTYALWNPTQEALPKLQSASF
jgi:UDP-2,3-diacylglucosamine hydrolase